MWDLVATLWLWLVLAAAISVGYDIHTYDERLKKWQNEQMDKSK